MSAMQLCFAIIEAGTLLFGAKPVAYYYRVSLVFFRARVLAAWGDYAASDLKAHRKQI